MKLNIKKNILKALVSAIVISIVPFMIYKDVGMLFKNLLAVFIGVIFGCIFIDVMYRVYELKKEQRKS